MKNYFFTLLLLFSITMNAQNKAQLIYVGDAMCSWCYGFAPEITKVKAHFENTLDFKLINGGLRPYNTESIVSLADFLKEHWHEIGKLTGQKFSYEILQNKTFIYDTEPASRAVLVCRNLKPEKEFEFFKATQELFYFQNKETNKAESYKTLVQGFGIDYTAFENQFNSAELKQQTKKDFESAGALGVSGFPSIVLFYNNKYVLISNGYCKAETIISTIQNQLK